MSFKELTSIKIIFNFIDIFSFIWWKAEGFLKYHNSNMDDDMNEWYVFFNFFLQKHEQHMFELQLQSSMKSSKTCSFHFNVMLINAHKCESTLYSLSLSLHAKMNKSRLLATRLTFCMDSNDSPLFLHHAHMYVV